MSAAPPYAMDAAQNRLSDGVVALAPSSPDDVEAVMRWDADPDVQRWFDWPLKPPWDDPGTFAARRASAERTLLSHAASWEAGTQFTFVIRSAATGESLGWIDLQPRGSGRGNISYGVLPAARAKGAATRSVLLTSRYAFDVLGWARLEIVMIADNVASARVALKAGFQPEGVLRSYGAYEHHQPLVGRRFDWAIYARLADDELIPRAP